MPNQGHDYKYSCRDCRIREHCINQSDTAARVKEMIRNAFAARTDTLSTWAVLQKNCLLVKADEERERKANEESLLSRRLREARDQSAGPALPENEPSPEPAPDPALSSPPSSGPALIGKQAEEDRSPATPRSMKTTHLPHPERAVPPEEVQISARQASPPPRSQTDSLPVRRRTAGLAGPCWLTVFGSNRHIALPATGQLVLGRFDPTLDSPLDVDLSFEDQHFLTVSRRHAKIIGANGRYTIKDLGSSNGVFLNDEAVTLGLSRQLQPGDYIRLGRLKLRYSAIPRELQDPARAARLERFLMVAFNGRKQVITPPDDITIGRYGAAFDLSGDDDVAERVLDQHAVITWRNGAPQIKDLTGSPATRLNGETLPAGQFVPLNPGDHICLNGCVLAYDVRRPG